MNLDYFLSPDPDASKFKLIRTEKNSNPNTKRTQSKFLNNISRLLVNLKSLFLHRNDIY